MQPGSTTSGSVLVRLNGTAEAFAVIDEGMLDLVNQFTWYRNQSGYAFTKSKRLHIKFLSMHRLIAGQPDGLEVDHINGNTLDNRRENLRTATHQQNLENRARGANSNSSTGVRGVHWDKRTKKFQAQIRAGGVTKYLGRFTDLDEARAATEKARAAAMTRA